MTVSAWLDREAWPWAPRSAALPEGTLHYVDEGAGLPVVFVHGTPTWSFEWRHALAALRGTHRVLALDHLGFGLSDRPANAAYTPEAHAVRFAQFMDRAVPAGPVSLVVHDVGGPIALDWALDHADRLARVVVVNSWMWPLDEDPAMRRQAGMISGAVGRWLYRRVNLSQQVIMPAAYANRKALTPAIHRQYLSVFPDAASRERVLFPLAKALLGSTTFYARLWERREALGATPMTLAWGTRDRAFGTPFLDRWVGAFPHASVVRFEDAGHWPHEEEPERFTSSLRSLLDRP